MNMHPSRLDEFGRRLLSESCDNALARQFHAHVLASGQLQQGIAVFEKLLGQNPQDAELSGLYIALCLESGENLKALEAVREMLSYTRPDDAFLDAALSVLKKVDAAALSGSRKDPRLSVCMIVRNESRHLAACLHNLLGFADEIVVVDTGSTDRSQDIAGIFGVTQLSFAWCDDFAAARNYSLEHAAGEWILVLDADERIAPHDFKELRRITASDRPKDVAYALTTRNYSNAANSIGLEGNSGAYGPLEAGLGWFPSEKVRLFRNRPAIRFHFPVHERVEPALRKAGVTIRRCRVPIHHYGHLNEMRNRTKARHYYQLGYAKLHRMKNDPHALRELAVQAGQLGRWTEAVDLWERLLALRPDYPEAYINMAGACWQTGDYESALAFSKKAVMLVPRQKEARFNLAVSLMMCGRPEQSVLELSAILANNPDYTAARFMTAIACSLAGDDNQAQRKLLQLCEKLDPSVLKIAMDDLITKCRRSKLEAFAASIARMKSSLVC